jgi:phosphonate transport system ATP-binding protein
MPGQVRLENQLMSVLSVKNLRVRYSAKGPEILKGIDFEVQSDDFLAMIGPSGAGKSTLIRCVNRLVEPTDGQIFLLGQDVRALKPRGLRELRRNVGMIFQEFNLINRMSVMDNVLSGRLGYTGNIRSLFRYFPKKDITMALDFLDRVGLSEHINKRADELSGGQRQRVGIARALMQQPKLLLLDEPTSALDPKISREVMALIMGIAKELGVPALCNIHDVQLAKEFCNRIIGLQDGYKRFDGITATLKDSDLEDIYSMEVL